VRRLRTAVLGFGLLLGSAANALAPGDPAPDFNLAVLDGSRIRLSDLRGKVVLVNFWASWCEPCLQEMPRFSGWQRTLGGAGLRVIGISMDDGEAPVRRLLSTKPVSYPVVLGDEHLALRFGRILGLPQSFLIDRHGIVRARFQGEVDLAKIEAAIRAQLEAAQ